MTWGQAIIATPAPAPLLPQGVLAQILSLIARYRDVARVHLVRAHPRRVWQAEERGSYTCAYGVCSLRHWEATNRSSGLQGATLTGAQVSRGWHEAAVDSAHHRRRLSFEGALLPPLQRPRMLTFLRDNLRPPRNSSATLDLCAVLYPEHNAAVRTRLVAEAARAAAGSRCSWGSDLDDDALAAWPPGVGHAVTALSLWGCTKLSDSGIRLLLCQMPQLQQLNVGGTAAGVGVLRWLAESRQLRYAVLTSLWRIRSGRRAC
jgi:hypothetical protein